MTSSTSRVRRTHDPPAPPGFHFDEADAQRAIDFFAKRLRHVEGPWAGHPFVLEPWQHDIVWNVFGWKREDGWRRYTTVYVEIPRKNGKSTFGAGLALKLLTADGEFGAQVYGAAEDRDQATIIFRIAAAMVRQDKVLRARCEIIDSSKRIVVAHKLALPNVTRRYFGYDTPIIIQNLGSVATTAVALFISFDRSQEVSVPTPTIQPGRSAVIDPNFTPGLVDGTQYSVTITSAQPISAVVSPVRIDGGPGVASAYNALVSGSSELWGPYFAKNAAAPAGTSPIVIQNQGPAETTPQVTVSILVPTPSNCCIPTTYRYTGPPLAPYTAWALDVRYQACDNCGQAVDLADGSMGAFKIQTMTHGATAIDPNGVIAAVVLPTSDTTAMAYQARPPATTAFLPNVTRRLGGASGWTTPIRLSGAGSVTMRWFRLSDGGLVLTQHVGVGQSCCGEAPIARYRAVTIDPRDIAELTDDTQYSVTITGDVPATGQPPAPFSVIVTELAEGGDNAMAYEGFAGP